MAYANAAQTTVAHGGLRALTRDLVARFERHQAFRATLRELNQLTNRELADLGMHRSELRRIAYDATYEDA